MEYYRPMLIKLIVVNCLFVLCASQSFDFFYFVQQETQCDLKRSCCYPTTGKPALDFGIHVLWPNYNNGSYPSSCDKRNLYDETEHSYFKAALTIKEKVNLLSVLKNAGSEPGGFYSLEAVKEAIKNGIGYEAAIECNKDLFGNSQLYQVYLCVDKYGIDLIECPILPKRKCNETIEFATFGPGAFVEERSFLTLSFP
ncbi:hypothetical protein T459_27220 [Capsicum annuum]|uniref:Uncharacterized protein n=1 Tax=Capsicum annuum TaxID=4072 RepID=A0A2G2YDA4_CAPAN|nr:hypothetical protein T459_27220 [Capsicum annuum]